MNKSEAIEKAAAKCGVTYSESERYLNTFINLIYEVLSKGGEMNISGFGKFRPYQYKSRIGVNPRDPKVKMEIKSRRIPKFTPGESFKQAIKK